MTRAKLWILSVALAGALAVGAAAAVAPSHTTPVTATLTAARTMVNESTCTGDDGQYRRAQEIYAGAVTGDSRLSGVAALYQVSVVNTTTGNGTAHGVLLVTDAISHQVKVRALYSSVVSGAGLAQTGYLTGLVRDNGSQPGGLLSANFTGVRAGTTLLAGIGTTGTTAHPAVIQRPACSQAVTRGWLKRFLK